MNWHERYLQQASWTRDLRCYLFEKSHFPAARRVLEVGCGTGAILADGPGAVQAGSSDIRGTGPIIHGLDLAPASLRECRKHAPAAHLACGDALCLPYPASAFDITFCHFLLLWVHDPLQALREMKRVTRSSGYVLALAEPDYSARSDKPAELAWLGQRQNEALQKQGAAQGRGAELADLFYRAGISLIETGPIRSPDNPALTFPEWESEWKVLEDDLRGTVSPLELSRIKELDRQALHRGGHMFNIPTYFAWGQV